MPIKARCHCGAIQFQIAEPPTELTSCNCSFCIRRGALVAYYKPDQVTVTTAPDRVWTYQWGTYAGQHHYCPVCGVGTHSEFPNFATGKPDYDDMQVSINARLIDGFDWESLPVKRVNGRDDW